MQNIINLIILSLRLYVAQRGKFIFHLFLVLCILFCISLTAHNDSALRIFKMNLLCFWWIKLFGFSITNFKIYLVVNIFLVKANTHAFQILIIIIIIRKCINSTIFIKNFIEFRCHRCWWCVMMTVSLGQCTCHIISLIVNIYNRWNPSVSAAILLPTHIVCICITQGQCGIFYGYNIDLRLRKLMLAITRLIWWLHQVCLAFLEAILNMNIAISWTDLVNRCFWV